MAYKKIKQNQNTSK